MRRLKVRADYNTLADNQSSLKTELEDRNFTTDEAADYLRISSAQLRNLCSQGRVRYYKLGRKNLFRKSDLERLLISNTQGVFYER